MTPQQALQLLDNVCSQINLSRADHARIVEAIQVLAALIARLAEDKPEVT